jgi:hypothetical protein
VAAGEDQPEPVVGDRVGLHGILGPQRLEAGQGLAFLGQAAISAQPVDGPVPGGGGDPRPRPVGDALPGPPLHGHHEGVLDGLLGQVEVAEDADEGCDRPSLLLAEQAVDDLARVGLGNGYSSPGIGMTGRTSTDPP